MTIEEGLNTACPGKMIQRSAVKGPVNSAAYADNDLSASGSPSKYDASRPEEEIVAEICEQLAAPNATGVILDEGNHRYIILRTQPE